MSHPARGAWIETHFLLACTAEAMGRTPPGVRGLKQDVSKILSNKTRRTPPGVRGLKQKMRKTEALILVSHPARGAWIETPA